MDIQILKEQILKEQIETQRNLLSTDRLDVSFGEIMSMYERREIIIRPAFQRYFRWDLDQKTRFMESILLGIPIPPIFVAEDGDGVWELVDGLQRISTVLSFFGILRNEDEAGRYKKNNWKLAPGERIEALKGFTYETLPNQFRLNVKRATCRVEILRWNRNYDMRFELFNRLNTGGSPLTSQEIRNCIYRDISTKFNDFLNKIAKDNNFLTLIDLEDEKYEQLYHEELALRFISLYKNQNITTSISQHMTSFMKGALDNPNFDYDRYEKIFSNVFHLLNPLGKTIFRQKDGRFATALYDVITIGVGENYEYYFRQSDPTQSILSKINQEVRTDAILKKFSTKGGNNQRARIINRLREARRIFGQSGNGQ